MESLFDFIFSNIWLLVIVFGVISSLFGGDKKKKGKEHRPQLDIPTMRTEKYDEPKQKAQPVEMSIPVQEDKPKEQKETTMAEEQLRYMQERLARQAADVDKKVIAIQQSATTSRKQGGVLPSYSQKSKLVNGIVMAEILGPPRAKKSIHRTK